MIQTKQQNQAKETDLQIELRELIQEIAQYSIDHVVVENLQKTERKLDKAIPIMDKQIEQLKTTVSQLDREKEKILSGIKSEHKFLVEDRSRLDQIKKDITNLSEQTKDALLSLTNENLQLRKKIEQTMSENIAVKKTINSITEATTKVESELAKNTLQTEKLVETTTAGLENNYILQQNNHTLTFRLLITTLIIQFVIIIFLVV